MHDRITITTSLQSACYESFAAVMTKLEIGMSETKIADLLHKEMTEKGINEYWYDVPIFALIGADRFFEIANKDYKAKSPHKNVYLQVGDPVYIDIHPQDTVKKIWGDWNSMLVFRAREGIDDEELAFLEEIRDIQRKSFSLLNAQMTAADVAIHFITEYEKRNITLSDVRNTVGHSMHYGPKLPEKRIFLEKNNNTVLGEGLFAIEPGGYRKKNSGKGYLVGRFEEVVFIPKNGNARLLGIDKPLALHT
jgi:Xaa-Pro aminopeptidase